MRQCVPLLEWVMYFAPALFFAYIAALCTALILTSLFLVHVRNPKAIPDAEIFGCS